MLDLEMWKGLFPATVLPFKADYSIDEAEQRKLIRFLLKVKGVSGFACNGHASDVWSLEREERDRITKIHVEETNGRIPVICGISGHTLKDYVVMMEDAKKSGASAVLVLPPPIFRNISLQRPDRAYQFFSTLANAVDIPIVIFQHMIFMGNHYSPETLAKLTEIENVIAVKASVGDVKLYEKELIALRKAPRKIAILASSDVLLFPYLALGHFSGSLVSIGSLAPHWLADMIEAFNQNDINRARQIYEKLFPIVDMFYNTPGINNSAFIKEALHILGILANPCVMRLPHPTFTDEQRASIRRVLDDSGLTDFYENLT